MQPVRVAYQKLGADVILIDWRKGNQFNYWQASSNVRTVGAMVGQLITKWNIIERTRLVGFSLGGQTLGEAARYVQRMTNGKKKVPTCHGLDPAGPWFTGCPDIMLQKSDCTMVEVLHTSAAPKDQLGITSLQFGTDMKTGHRDFWVNCGFDQGPCQVRTYLTTLQSTTKVKPLLSFMSSLVAQPIRSVDRSCSRSVQHGPEWCR